MRRWVPYFLMMVSMNCCVVGLLPSRRMLLWNSGIRGSGLWSRSLLSMAVFLTFQRANSLCHNTGTQQGSGSQSGELKEGGEGANPAGHPHMDAHRRPQGWTEGNGRRRGKARHYCTITTHCEGQSGEEWPWSHQRCLSEGWTGLKQKQARPFTLPHFGVLHFSIKQQILASDSK